MSRIAVAMSGGVDSSVVAALLQQQGHEVIGITMQLFEPCNSGPGTPAHDGAQVAAQLGIPHHLLRLEPQFRDLIIDNFINQPVPVILGLGTPLHDLWRRNPFSNRYATDTRHMPPELYRYDIHGIIGLEAGPKISHIAG